MQHKIISFIDSIQSTIKALRERAEGGLSADMRANLQKHHPEDFARLNTSINKLLKSLSNTMSFVQNQILNNPKQYYFEMFQNIEDAALLPGRQTEIRFYLIREEERKNHLLIVHNGRHFSPKDIESICDIHSDNSAKRSNTSIGHKGIGFKAIFTRADKVFIESGPAKFKFDRHHHEWTETTPWQMMPIPSDWNDYPDAVSETAAELRRKFTSETGCEEPVHFMISLNKTKRDGTFETEFSTDDIEWEFDGIAKTDLSLLFLNRIRNIKMESYKLKTSTISRGEIVPIRSWGIQTEERYEYGLSKIMLVALSTGGTTKTAWLKKTFEVPSSEVARIIDPVKDKPRKKTIEFATPIRDDGRLNYYRSRGSADLPLSTDHSRFFCYLPITGADYGFPFIVNADFTVSADRHSLTTADKFNGLLFKKMAEYQALFVKALCQHGHQDAFTRLFFTDQKRRDPLFGSFTEDSLKHIINTPFFPNKVNDSIKFSTLQEIAINTTSFSFHHLNPTHLNMMQALLRLTLYEIKEEHRLAPIINISDWKGLEPIISHKSIEPELTIIDDSCFKAAVKKKLFQQFDQIKPHLPIMSEVLIKVYFDRFNTLTGTGHAQSEILLLPILASSTLETGLHPIAGSDTLTLHPHLREALSEDELRWIQEQSLTPISVETQLKATIETRYIDKKENVRTLHMLYQNRSKYRNYTELIRQYRVFTVAEKDKLIPLGNVFVPGAFDSAGVPILDKVYFEGIEKPEDFKTFLMKMWCGQNLDVEPLNFKRRSKLRDILKKHGVPPDRNFPKYSDFLFDPRTTTAFHKAFWQTAAKHIQEINMSALEAIAKEKGLPGKDGKLHPVGELVLSLPKEFVDDIVYEIDLAPATTKQLGFLKLRSEPSFLDLIRALHHIGEGEPRIKKQQEKQLIRVFEFIVKTVRHREQTFKEQFPSIGIEDFWRQLHMEWHGIPIVLPTFAGVFSKSESVFAFHSRLQIDPVEATIFNSFSAHSKTSENRENITLLAHTFGLKTLTDEHAVVENIKDFETNTEIGEWLKEKAIYLAAFLTKETEESVDTLYEELLKRLAQIRTYTVPSSIMVAFKRDGKTLIKAKPILCGFFRHLPGIGKNTFVLATNSKGEWLYPQNTSEVLKQITVMMGKTIEGLKTSIIETCLFAESEEDVLRKYPDLSLPTRRSHVARSYSIEPNTLAADSQEPDMITMEPYFEAHIEAPERPRTPEAPSSSASSENAAGTPKSAAELTPLRPPARYRGISAESSRRVKASPEASTPRTSKRPREGASETPSKRVKPTSETPGLTSPQLEMIAIQEIEVPSIPDKWEPTGTISTAPRVFGPRSAAEVTEPAGNTRLVGKCGEQIVFRSYSAKLRSRGFAQSEEINGTRVVRRFFKGAQDAPEYPLYELEWLNAEDYDQARKEKKGYDLELREVHSNGDKLILKRIEVKSTRAESVSDLHLTGNEFLECLRESSSTFEVVQVTRVGARHPKIERWIDKIKRFCEAESIPLISGVFTIQNPLELGLVSSSTSADYDLIATKVRVKNWTTFKSLLSRLTAKDRLDYVTLGLE